jgi:hypothetical protein
VGFPQRWERLGFQVRCSTEINTEQCGYFHEGARPLVSRKPASGSRVFSGSVSVHSNKSASDQQELCGGFIANIAWCRARRAEMVDDLCAKMAPALKDPLTNVALSAFLHPRRHLWERAEIYPLQG